MRSERRPRRSWPHPEVRRRYLQSRRCRAGAFSEARFRIERSWNSNSDRTGFPGLLFDLLNETCDELNTSGSYLNKRIRPKLRHPLKTWGRSEKIVFLLSNTAQGWRITDIKY